MLMLTRWGVFGIYSIYTAIMTDDLTYKIPCRIDLQQRERERESRVKCILPLCTVVDNYTLVSLAYRNINGPTFG